MQVVAHRCLATALLCLFIVRSIDCFPSQISSASRNDNGKYQLLANEGQKVDQDVQDLENLKPIEDKSMSVVKTHSSMFTNINGKKVEQSETKEEINKDGKLVARVHQKMTQKDDGSAPTPLTLVRTELEIPQQGIHKVIESPSISNEKNEKLNSNSNPSKRKMFYNEFLDNNMDSSNFGVQFSPLDMAEYIFLTGDEKGVTSAIEEFLLQGVMSREDAITYLHDIKSNLEYLQRQYTEEQLQHENNEQPIVPLRKSLTLLQKARQAHNEASELMEIRQQMRDNISKKSADPIDPETVQMNQRLLQAGVQGISDDDYDDLLERLRVADFLYTEYSLEEVIYQLAKVMFSQSLTRGSSEAQEALEKFTRFLETEAEMGRISRSLEKKVLDVLIAGLTDTLTEHPELVAVARESLGGGSTATNSIDDQLLQQLLILNPSIVDKTESTKGNLLNMNNVKNHRFILSNKNPDMEPAAMKKNSIKEPSSMPLQNGKTIKKST